MGINKRAEDVKILVVGDIMLDRYVCGTVDRISPEFPVPIVNVTKEYHTLGGCGNVVRNLRELGAQVDCLSFVGGDLDGNIIKNELNKIGVNPHVLMTSKDYTTISKTRIIADERKVQMLRIDHEDIKDINVHKVINHFNSTCRKRCQRYDIIVVSDYAKGMITLPLMKFLRGTRLADIIVDPKPSHSYMYDGAYMITPNDKEYKKMVDYLGYGLIQFPYVIRTRGKDGMTVYNNEDRTSRKKTEIESTPVEVSNVSGAGDTVVAVLSLCLSMGYSPEESATIANQCAAYVVTQPGTSVFPKNMFMKLLQTMHGIII